MHWVTRSAAGLCCAVVSVSCGTSTLETSSDTVSMERGPAPPSITSSSLNMNDDRILPNGSEQASVSVTVDKLPKKVGVALTFTGDDAVWDVALPQTSSAAGTFTFAGTIATGTQIGSHDLSWDVRRTDTNALIGSISHPLEVTCADNDFCGGEERWSRGACVDGAPPCDDGEDCTDDICDGVGKHCTHVPEAGDWDEDCQSCDAKNCIPNCANGQECGDDGCGGACTSDLSDDDGNCLGGLFCVAGTCLPVADDGTCAAPLPLFGEAGGINVPDEGIITTVGGNNSEGFDLVTVSCGVEGIPELVYEFDVTTRMGFEIRMLSATGDPGALDTVLAIHGDDCFTQAGGRFACADDSTPPGELGSLVRGLLDPAEGTYKLIATGFSASQVGDFILQIKFVPDCVPTCDGKFCGDDGCGGVCGTCTLPDVCDDDSGRCGSGGECVGSCKGRQCGSDGCEDGACGECPEGQLCADEIGKCLPADTCDHMKPECGNCPTSTYCGSDCQCHHVDEKLIDLIPAGQERFEEGIEFEWREFTGSSCAIAEQCVPGPGKFLLMRFGTDILNQGVAGFVPGDPVQDPSNFHYHECHQHYHFEGFAEYDLLALDGKTKLEGRKQSYCMEDSYQYLQGPSIPCDPESTCDDQGIQAGWADVYPNVLDCQWLVIASDPPSDDDLPMGQWYYHRTCTNTGRVFHEQNFDNNCRSIPVFIPASVPQGGVLKYSDVVPTSPPPPQIP